MQGYGENERNLFYTFSFHSFAIENMEPKERILLRAHELFNRFGFRRVTMDEIALKTGMSKKTIYQIFATKDDIVSAIIDDHINKSTSRCISDTCGAQNAIHEIFLNIDMVQEHFADMNPLILDDLEKYFPAVFLKLYKHKNDFILKMVKANLQRGITEELYRQDINIDILSKLRIATMFIPFDQEIFPYTKYKFIEVEREILEHFLYGISTSQGQKLIKKYKQQRIQ